MEFCSLMLRNYLHAIRARARVRVRFTGLGLELGLRLWLLLGIAELSACDALQVVGNEHGHRHCLECVSTLRLPHIRVRVTG